MKKYLAVAFLFLQPYGLFAQEETLPAELQPFIAPGYTLLSFVKADLNADGRQDYILAMKSVEEDTLSFDNPDWDAARPMLVVIRKADGSLYVAASNTSLLPCRLCGGSMPDPLEAIRADKGNFFVDTYGGSSWRWAETVKFSYNAVKKNWFLSLHVISSFQAADPEHTSTEATITAAETGPINFTAYRPEYNTDSSQWTVNVAKTFFYNSPQTGSKPRKAFLLRGDQVKGFKTFANFVECSFTNSSGQLTTGYILRRHLAPVRKQ